MKKYLTALAILLAGTAAEAEDYALKVALNEGNDATYVLSEKPVITYSDEKVIIQTANLADEYPIKAVKSFSFIENVTGVSETLPDNAVYDFRDNVFTCENHTIRVINPEGRCVVSGQDRVSLETLGRGVYIVNTGNRTIKVFRN